MKQRWDEQEHVEHWTLTHHECELLRNRTDWNRMGFAALLKFFQVEGRFPSDSWTRPGTRPDLGNRSTSARSRATSRPGPTAQDVINAWHRSEIWPVSKERREAWFS